MSDYNKFQYSYFIANGAQLVIRNDDYADFINDVKRVQEDFIPTTGSSTASRPTITPSSGTLCSIHNAKMKDKISKNNKPYKAHYRKIGEDWDICFGKGWESEREGASALEIKQKLDKKEEEEVEPNDIPF